MFIDFLQSNLIKEVYNNRTENSSINNLQEELISLRKRKQFFDEQYKSGIINETLYVKSDELIKERYNYLTNLLTNFKNSNYLMDSKTEMAINRDTKNFIIKLLKILKNSKSYTETTKEVINELVATIHLKDYNTSEFEFNLKISLNLFTTILGKIENDIYEN